MNARRSFIQLLRLICGALALFTAIGLADTPYVILDGKKADPFSVITRLKGTDAVHRAQVAKLLAEMGLRITNEMKLVPGIVTVETLKADRKKKRPRYDLGPQQAKELKRIIRKLQASGLFRYVEPNYIAKADATPTDEGFTGGYLWGLQNNGQDGGVAGMDVGAVEAWDVTTGSYDVLVAVIDTGIRATHRDLAPNMWINRDEIAGNGVDDDRDGYIDNMHGMNSVDGNGDSSDANGHGTHCAGTIGAAANNDSAITGVAWKVKIMACKVLGEQGSVGDSVLRGVDFAVTQGARILSMSLGGNYAGTQAERDIYEAAGRKGALFVVAAGNDALNTDVMDVSPVNHSTSTMIGVAAIDRAGNLANFSNYGQGKIHLAAPGVDIWSCGHLADDGVDKKDGTSMATPHVSGVAALVLAKFPTLSAVELRQRLLSSVVPTASLAGRTVTGGRVNAKNALGIAPDASMELSFSPLPGTSIQAGQALVISVSLTDLGPVTNATVTGRTAQGTQVNFLNNGTAPDAVANDHIYTASLTAPANAAGITLELTANAPGKNPISQNLSYPVATIRSNDRFQDRVVIEGVNASFTSENITATLDPGEAFFEDLTGQTVWWTWTPSVAGRVAFSTQGSDFDTVLAIYEGNSHQTLRLLLASDDLSDDDFTSAVIFEAVAGRAYQIMVDGSLGDFGNIRLNMRQQSSGNDNFAQRTVISGQEVEVSATNEGASKEPGEPDHADEPGGKSLWWSWTTPGPGRVEIATDFSDFDTMLAVYVGSSLADLQLVASNDDTPLGDLVSSVVFNARAGQTYHIAVDGFEGEFGEVNLRLRQRPGLAAPQNDDFANAPALSGISASASGSNRGATKQPGEPDHDDNLGGQSIWWSWQAPSNGSTRVSTEGSDFDTILAVYSVGQNSQLTYVASNDDAESEETFTTGYSILSFNAQAGVLYAIAVEGFRDDELQEIEEGNIKLALQLGEGNVGLVQSARLQPELLSGGKLRLTLAGPPGTYALQSSRVLNAWQDLAELTTDASGRASLESLSTVGAPAMFYRARRK